MAGNEIRCPLSDEELDRLLGTPSDRLIAFFREQRMRRLAILGIGGKIGVTLGIAAASAAKIAGCGTEILGISRFSDPVAREKLEASGVTTISCDLLDQDAVQNLPDADAIIFMAGRKFGTAGDASLTWAMNSIAPVNAARRYMSAPTVVFSTGCVYPLALAESAGCDEHCPPVPLGEYAQSALARERIFEYFSRTAGTPVTQFRLNYAIDLRYGVLHDIAMQVWREKPVDIAVRNFNCIWQGDVIERAILSLELCGSPPCILNISGPETISTADVARFFASEFDKETIFEGENQPASPGYLCNAGLSFRHFGYPSVPLAAMLRLTAEWIAGGGSSLDKPTHFQVTDGQF